MRKLSEKENWLFDFVLAGPGGRRTFGEIGQAHDLKYRTTLTNNYLKVLVYNLREHGRDITNVRTFGYAARPAAGDGRAEPSTEAAPAGQG